MRYSPVKILQFLTNHYNALKALFDLCKTSPIITPEQLRRLDLTDLTTKLVDYKILRTLPDGLYKFEKRYFDFLAFLVSDFSLYLPAQLAKYQQSLAVLFSELEQAPQNGIPFVAQKIIDELTDFLAHLDGNTEALMQEADGLRSAKREHITYTQQVKKAVYLISKFLEPLNLILDEHEEGILNVVRRRIGYVHDKLLKAFDTEEKMAYEDLHAHLCMVEKDLQRNLSIVVNELLPLLMQIKVGHPILQGLKRFRDAYRKGEEGRYMHFLPKLHDKKPRNRPFKYDFALAAENVLAMHRKPRKRPIHKPEPMVPPWYFREAFYQRKLAASLPLDNFFLWCYEALAEEEGMPVDLHKFFKVTGLLFKRGFKVTFVGRRQTLRLADVSLNIPYVNIQPT